MTGGADLNTDRDVPANDPPFGESRDGDLLAGLTEPQREAVLHETGPLLVLASAGSGKTRVITRRIAYLISRGVGPWSILALTFTNKAAGEMRERVHSILGHEGERAFRGLTVTTFHSLCARLLRRYAEPAGLRPDFTIYDSGDQASLCKKALDRLNLSTSNFPPRSVLAAISNAKNALQGPAQFAAQASDWSGRNVARIYDAYTKGLRAANAVDFDDLLLFTAEVLRQDAGVRGELQRRWRHLLIDEYQDTNHAQFVIASLLAGDGKDSAALERELGIEEQAGARRGPNICVVGDPDQAIYAWRGADIANILEFEEHYPGARVITLGENFRSTAPILAAADALIKKNVRRKDKPLFTTRQGGERVEATLCRDERHEAAIIVDWLRAHHQSHPARAEGLSARRSQEAAPPLAWRDMAVLYRTNALSRVLEEAFRQEGVAYTIARGTAFYEREEVRNALAYLRVVANGADDVSLERIVNTPARGIGAAALTTLQNRAAADDVPLLKAMREAGGEGGLSHRATGGVAKFVGMIDSWTGGGRFLGGEAGGALPALVDRVIKESGLQGMYQSQAKASGSETDLERLDNLDELVSSARQFEGEYDASGDPANEPASRGEAPAAPPLLAMLRAYLESVALVADADAVDPAQGSVTLMTLHAAKGLEFGAVAIVGLEEGTLPHARALVDEAQMEEERRLCFVGMTRAMSRLHLTSAKYRTHRGLSERTIPSRFLSELPREKVRFSDRSDASAGVPGWTDGDDAPPREAPSRPQRQPRPAPGGDAPPPTRGPEAGFPVGCTVRHPQFGVGKVLAVTPGLNAKAVIAFKDVGTKTLVLEHARLARVRERGV